MFTLKSAALLALVGSAFAAPVARRQFPAGFSGLPDGCQFTGNTDSAGQQIQYEQVVNGVTYLYVCDSDGSSSQPTSTTTTSTGSTNAGSAEPAATTYATTTTSTGSSGTSSGAPAAVSGGGSSDYMTIVNKYRTAGGLPTLTEDATMQQAALTTVQNGNGQMVHSLLDGSMAQVLAPGSASDFLNVYVGGWLCEIPSLPGLDGICTTMDAGWDHTETGHAQILTSTSYTQIGCAYATGSNGVTIWGCNLK